MSSIRFPTLDTPAVFPNESPIEVWDLARNRVNPILSSDLGQVVVLNNPRAQTCLENVQKIDKFFREIFIENPVQKECNSFLSKLLNKILCCPLAKDSPHEMIAHLNDTKMPDNAWWSNQCVHFSAEFEDQRFGY